MKKIISITLFLLLTCSYTAIADIQKIDNEDMRVLKIMMTGSFSSEAQSKADTNFLHITLRMAPIWDNRRDGFWLYVEQAVAGIEDRPYRQRIYNVYQKDETTIVSKVYEMPNPEMFVGAWKETEKFEELSFYQLIDRHGCSIHLNKTGDNVFTGSTVGKECLSSLRGAIYATSEVVIRPEGMITLDRGWNDAGEQVWGSVGGGYIFDKVW